jgi:hypothetical protein
MNAILRLVLLAQFLVFISVAAEPPVSGTFTGNGKPAKLAYVSATKGEPFDGKDTTVLVFTEKDHAAEQHADIIASFGKFGSALILIVNSEGKIISCEVAHSALSKTPFSSSGVIEMKEFKKENGEMSGKVSTGGEHESLGQKWNVDLTFHTKAP